MLTAPHEIKHANTGTKNPSVCVFFLLFPYPGLLSVQQPNARIEIPGEGDPEKVRDLQVRGDRIDLPERQDHPKNQDPQRDEPDERPAKGLPVEENDAPEEVDSQLNEIQLQAAGSVLRRRR